LDIDTLGLDDTEEIEAENAKKNDEKSNEGDKSSKHK
jgi:hypothetical protein